jgi:hypothetical protein
MRNSLIKNSIGKKIGYFLLVLILFGIVGCTDQEAVFKESKLEIGMSFSAKNMCSCFYVSEQSEDFCRDLVKVKQLPIQPSVSIDHKNKIIETSLFFFVSRKAQFLGPERGCAAL